MNDRATDAAPQQPSGAGAPPAGAPAPAPAQSNPTPAASDGSIKETIESIVIAFILAFIFRGFIVEAFVIPTGSMAPTLLGAHMRFACPDCGYRYEVNYQSEGADADEVNIPTHAVVREVDPRTGRFTARAQNRVLAIHCPNCGYKLPRVDPSDPANDATAPPVRYGDRILVLKYLYLFAEPDRWDVVVFKAPFNPEKYDYGQNYIKRLIGKPGESIFILDGDIYVGKPGAPVDEFVVQTKPDHVQDALWRIVYDNDYHPRGLDPGWVQPWTAQPGEKGWETQGRDLAFDDLTGGATLAFHADKNPAKHALTDWLAYDVTAMQQGRRDPDTYHMPSYSPHNNVSDLKLSFYYRRDAGDGPLTVRMSKLDHVFEARVTPDGAQLFMGRAEGNMTPVGDAVPVKSNRGRAMKVELINADYQVELRIDGRVVARTTREQYRPDIAALLKAAENGGKRLPRPQVSITAERQTARFEHVGLWRDVYYLNREEAQGGAPVRWGSPHSFPDNVIQLGADEYFVLGDNSLLSGDARGWKEAINLPDEDLFAEEGRVPGRFMIGKAFFVYWPAGYRPLNSAPALVPNFGDMRFIH